MRAGNAALADLVAARAEGYLSGERRSPRVIRALRAVDRADFLPAECRSLAYRDEPLPIGRGQTCSQPSMVAFMLDELRLEPGMRVLEVGAGSGYAACVAAELVGPGGSVLAGEIKSELAAAARFNARRWSPVVEVVEGDGSRGLEAEEDFDRVFLSAGILRGRFSEEPLLRALVPGGVLMYPEAAGDLIAVRKAQRQRGRVPSAGENERRSWRGVSFVPLAGENS